MLKLLKKNRFSVFLQIIQLTAVFIVLMFLVSTIIYRMNYYAPIKAAAEEKGFWVDVSTAQNLRTEAEIKEMFPETTQIWGVLSYNFLHDDKDIDTLVYNDEILDNLFIKLDSGSIDKLNKSDKNYCLISNGLGYSTGDEIELSNEDSKVTFVVAGVISDDQQILGFTQEQKSYKNDYRDFYLSYNSEICIPIMITSENTMNRLGINCIYNEQAIISFSESDVDENALIQKLSDEWAMYRGSCDDLKELSRNYIQEQLFIILPIIICVLLLTIFTSVSSNAINAKRNLRNYAIFYMCGATWKKCMSYCIINSFFVSLVSLFFSLIILFIGKITFWSETVITLGIWQMLACLIALLVHVTMSMLIPLLMIGNVQPRDILKR